VRVGTCTDTHVSFVCMCARMANTRVFFSPFIFHPFPFQSEVKSISANRTSRGGGRRKAGQAADSDDRKDNDMRQVWAVVELCDTVAWSMGFFCLRKFISLSVAWSPYPPPVYIPIYRYTHTHTLMQTSYLLGTTCQESRAALREQAGPVCPRIPAIFFDCRAGGLHDANA